MAGTPTTFSIHQAAKEGNITLLKKTPKKDLNRGDEDGWTAVHWTAWNGNTEALKTVISRGGDVDKYDDKGSTPLHVAATYGHLEAVEIMVEHRANMFALDNNGRTPAKVAAFYQKADCCRYLDTLAVRWQVENRDLVERLQVRAMKELTKRARKASEEKEGAGKPKKSTAPNAISADSKQRSISMSNVHEGKKKKKMSQQEALRQNFELRPSHSADHLKETTKDENDENMEDDDHVFTHSAATTFRPTPNAGPLLNTLASLAQPPLPPHSSLESGFVSQGRSASNSSSETSLSPHGSRVASAGTSRRSSGHPEFDTLPAQPMIIENDSPLATFLQSLDLLDCIKLLHKEKLDLEALALCDEKDLIGIGLPLGPRKKILHGIQRRMEIMANPGHLTDTEL